MALKEESTSSYFKHIICTLLPTKIVKDTLQTIYTSEHNVMRRSYSDLVGHKSFYFPKVTLIPAATSVEEDTGDLNTNFKRKSTALVQTGRTERGFNFTAI